MRPRFYVAYDTRDPSDAAICNILDKLGRRRSDVVNSLIVWAGNRYGWDVLKRENVDVLLYLLHSESIKGQQESMDSLITYDRTATDMAKQAEKKQRIATQQIREPTEGTGIETLPRGTDTSHVPGTPPETVSSAREATPPVGDADKMRRNFVNFLNNGFYDQEN